MNVEIIREPPGALAEYGAISIAFTVRTVLDVREDGGRFLLTERPVDAPYVKDYDAHSGEGPAEWARRFDVSRWGIWTARAEGRRVGGTVVAFDTPGVHMLEGRRDLAVLWDIRVAPEARGGGVGGALFRAAEAWARERGCRELRVETQNVNAPACRFYARQGCVLAEARRLAYPELPEEIQLIWRKTWVGARPL